MTGLKILVLILNFCHYIGAPWNSSDMIENLTPQAATTECPSCPPWFYHKKGQCKPGELPPDGSLTNHSRDGRMSVLECYCATFDDETCTTEVGKCIFNCENPVFNKSDLKNEVFRKLPADVSMLNRLICNRFNRTGTLCSQCKNGTFLLAYSFNLQCVACTDIEANWVKYALVAFIPLTAFCFIIFIFQINIVSSHLYGYTLYSQTISIPVLSRGISIALRNEPKYSFLGKMLLALYGIWNLDFFRSFDLGICLGTTTLQTLSLDLLVAVYPLLLMALSYALITLYDRNIRVLVIIWRPFRGVFSLFRKNWDIRTSLIDSFATFLYLSNVKFLNVAYDLLLAVDVYQLPPSGNLTISRRLFYDASIPYFGSEHLPYAVVAIAALAFFAVLPAMVLLLYPFRFFQKLLNLFPLQWQILHTFMDSFQGCYKNGTEPGTRDFRWFAFGFFLIRYILLIISVFVNGAMYFPLASIVLILTSILLVLLQPFKPEFQHNTNTMVVYVIFIALFYVSVSGAGFSVTNRHDMSWGFQLAEVLLICLPLLYVCTVTFQWIIAHRKFGVVLFQRWQARRHGYEML